MEHYVTLFDSGFLPQGLSLQRSLERHAGPATLWIVCMDEQVYRVIDAMHLPGVRLLALQDVETPQLLQVKPFRSRAEYCWTLTPFVPGFVFEADETVSRVTYVDADIWLRKSPRPIFDELENSGKSVLLTEHAYASEYDEGHKFGQYCVQFMCFVRGASDPVRHWWGERCLEWCSARPEDGKFGDQKYLDDWTERFDQYVHVYSRHEVFQGPWNAIRFPASSALVYHFHGLRLFKNDRYVVTHFHHIPVATYQAIYQPYAQELKAVVAHLRQQGVYVRPQSSDGVWTLFAKCHIKRLMAFWKRLMRPNIDRL